MSDWRTVTKREPCPVCAKPDWCAWSPDGETLKCERSTEAPPGLRLIKQKGGPGVLGKVLKVGSFLTGLPIGGGGSGDSSLLGMAQPVLRVPQMVHEGVAFAQGTIAGTSEEAPLWRSGFMSLSLAKGAGRMAVKVLQCCSHPSLVFR